MNTNKKITERDFYNLIFENTDVALKFINKYNYNVLNFLSDIVDYSKIYNIEFHNVDMYDLCKYITYTICKKELLFYINIDLTSLNIHYDTCYQKHSNRFLLKRLREKSIKFNELTPIAQQYLRDFNIKPHQLK